MPQFSENLHPPCVHRVPTVYTPQNNQKPLTTPILPDSEGLERSPKFPKKVSQTAESEFLALFPHRWDFCRAPHPDPGERPDWKTENRYPLNDREILEGKGLYAVSFGATTDYLLIDLDSESVYHPIRDSQILTELLAALEPIGITEAIAVQSSRSGGVHVYFPLSQKIKSWLIALVVHYLLEKAGFKIKPGQLEIFPNPRTVTGATPTSNYRAHRLPLQNGSYLLDRDWATCFSSQSIFVDRWKFAQNRNQIDLAEIERIAFQARRKRYGLTKSAQTFFDDLEAVIRLGWTGKGQTNGLLGWIAIQFRVFGQLIQGTATPLTEDEIASAIVTTARSLPGYSDFCSHQYEIEKRARDWARYVTSSPKYYPYGSRALGGSKKPRDPSEPTWNERQRVEARSRIEAAIAHLVAEGSYPDTIGGRIAAFKKLGINRGTLYRNLDLWHSIDDQKFTPEAENSEGLKPALEEEFTPLPNKFVPEVDLSLSGIESSLGSEVNRLIEPTLENSKPIEINQISVEEKESNSEIQLIDQTSQKENQTPNPIAPVESFANCPPDCRSRIREALEKAKQARLTEQKARSQSSLISIDGWRQNSESQKEKAKLKAWIESGDPLLASEASKALGLPPPD